MSQWYSWMGREVHRADDVSERWLQTGIHHSFGLAYKVVRLFPMGVSVGIIQYDKVPT